MRSKGDYFEAALRAERNRNGELDWLVEIINRLSGRPVLKHHEVEYWNHPELPEHLRAKGYYACFQTLDRSGYPLYVMISRSHTNEPIDLKQILAELSSKEIVFPFEKFGDYYAQRSRKRGPGTFATVKFGTRWYMLSRCGYLKPHNRLVKSAGRLLKQDEAFSYEELKQRATRAKLE